MEDNETIIIRTEIQRLEKLKSQLEKDIISLENRDVSDLYLGISLISGDLKGQYVNCWGNNEVDLKTMVKNIVLQLRNEVLKIQNQIRGLQLDSQNLSDDEQ